MKHKRMKTLALTMVTLISLAGCSAAATTEATTETTTVTTESTVDSSSDDKTVEVIGEADTSGNSSTTVSTTSGDSILDSSDMFSNRDLEQTADTSDAETITLTDGDEITIDEAGVYILKGSAENATVIVDVEDDDAKVQLVLDGVTITNEDAPAIYVKSADKVFVTTTDSENTLTVTGEFVSDGDTNLDAVIFSKDDITFNGVGTLTVTSETANGISGKDDLKITGGTYVITSEEDAIEANDSIRIYDGDITITTNKDGFHSENEDDLTLGYMYIQDGTIKISAADDGIQANAVLQIDGGDITVTTSTEGLEATYIQINGGNIDVYATDDGINASDKSDYDVVIEVNGGNINVEVGSGDTDGFDSNGVIYLNGGTINVTANSAFDSDRGTELSENATVTINGEVVTTISEQMMGPGGGGGMKGGTAPSDGSFPTDGSTSTDGEMPTRPEGGGGPGGHGGGQPPSGGMAPDATTSATEDSDN